FSDRAQSIDKRFITGSLSVEVTMKLVKKIPVYILFFALYPFVNIYAVNINHLHEFNELIPPIILTLAITAIVWGLLYIVWKDHVRPSLVTLVMLLLFFSYGHVY